MLSSPLIVKAGGEEVSATSFDRAANRRSLGIYHLNTLYYAILHINPRRNARATNIGEWAESLLIFIGWIILAEEFHWAHPIEHGDLCVKVIGKRRRSREPGKEVTLHGEWTSARLL